MPKRELFFCETFRHDGGVKALAKSRRHFVDLVTLVDLDSLMGGVEHDAAVLASGGVFADLFAEFSCKLIVEVVGKMAQ